MSYLGLEPFLLAVSGVVLAIIVIAVLWYFFQLHLYFYTWGLGLTPPKNRISVKYNVLVPMSDGVSLVADIYSPKGKGVYPTLLIRTPYAKGNTEHNYPLVANIFSSQGYVVIIQDVRGKYGSEGVFVPFAHEGQDGKDTIEWVTKQKWSDGKVAAWGFSYLGLCAWFLTVDAPKALKTIIPMFCCQNSYTGWIDSGVPYLKDILMWLALHHGRQGRVVTHKEIEELVFRLPVLQYDKRIKDGIDTFRTWMSHLHADEYWSQISVNDKRDRIEVPALFIGGWYDRFINNTIDDFKKTIAQNSSIDVGKSRIIIGPWGHEPTITYPDIDFGYYSKFRHQFKAMLKWLDFWLKDVKDDFENKKSIEYFMMGANEWRYSDSWPPKSTVEKIYYLTSRGMANTFNGDGLLDLSIAKDITQDYYLYDPENPAPTVGNRMLYGNETDGPREQSLLNNRKDILFYHSPILEKDLEVVGPLSVVIYVSSSAVDTDFIAKLSDLHPNGKAYYVVQGFVRMRYLDSVRATHGIEGSKIYRVEIDLGHTAYTFFKKHRLQLQIGSSDFPNHGRNLNTGGSNEGDSEEVTARQTVYHGGIYDSRLNLSIENNQNKKS